jgi:D-cysteine desulfhydrase
MASPSTEPALHRALPSSRLDCPHLPLGRFPTRVHRLAGLLPSDVELWIKREDESGERCGGSKLRKLEFLFGAARAAGKRRLVTFGGYGSHHVATAALHARANDFELEALLFPQPVDDHVRALLQSNDDAGARIRRVRSLVGVVPAMARTRLLGRVLGRDQLWMAGGGSCVTGTLGWVSGALELVAQVEAGEMPRFDLVYGALGSGGMIAGLVAGLGAWPLEVVGVRAVDAWMCGERTVRRLVDGVARRLDPSGGMRRRTAGLRVEGRQAGRYGLATAASLAATRLAADRGLTLDPIYTGKVMAQLLADAAAGRLAGRRILFVHSAFRFPSGGEGRR